MRERAGSQLLLFSLQSSHALGDAIAARLGVSLAHHEERSFEDGEQKARPLENVRGRDVFVVESLYADDVATVHDKLCRLLFFIGALKDAAAARVTAIVPYLCYARKDRKTKPRDPVTTRYVAALFEAVGTDHVVTVDVHNLAAFQNAFRCGTDHLEARPLLSAHLARRLGDDEVAIVSPDEGGMKRAEAYRATLAPRLTRPPTTALMEKQRSGGVVSGDRLFGDVAGKTAIIPDDVISTGTTICRAAVACREAGAKRVFAAATHGQFLHNAGARLLDAGIDELVITSTIPPFRLEHEPILERLTVLDIAPLLAESVRRIHANESIVELLEGDD